MEQTYFSYKMLRYFIFSDRSSTILKDVEPRIAKIYTDLNFQYTEQFNKSHNLIFDTIYIYVVDFLYELTFNSVFSGIKLLFI
jgi:hypothetical protein